MQVRKRNMTKEQFLKLQAPVVGENRNFEFDKRLFSIRSIIFPNPDIILKWTWGTRVDPKTQKRVTEEKNHTFYRIELLGTINIPDASLTIKDVIVLGFSLDSRIMVIPKDTYKEVFAQIAGFQKIKDSLGV